MGSPPFTTDLPALGELRDELAALARERDAVLIAVGRAEALAEAATAAMEAARLAYDQALDHAKEAAAAAVTARRSLAGHERALAEVHAELAALEQESP